MKEWQTGIADNVSKERAVEMCNYLFLGLIYDKSKEKLYLNRSKCGLQNAVNTFQWNLIDGFIANQCSIQLINALPVGTFPKQYKDVILPNLDWSYLNMSCYECGSINIPVLKQFEREIKIYRHILKWIRENTGEKHIISYSLYLPFQKAIKRIKRHYPEVKTTAIVTDLPAQYGLLPTNPIKKRMMIAHGNQMLSCAKYCDSFVLLTEQMKEPLNVGNRPYVVVEGICSADAPPTLSKESQKKIIFYSGTLHYQYGIRTLLDAFSLIGDMEAELWICGSGEAEGEIRQRLQKDNRIRFFGFCSSKKVAELRSQATVLVNPRTNDGEYTKYSFPSKTMEYMASGIPVVMYKLDGIPEEYAPYLHYVEGAGAEALKQALTKVLEQSEDERAAFGKHAQEFVLRKKNAVKQSEKLVNLF